MSKKIVKIKKMEKGVVLILSTLILGIMIFLSAYFISFSLTGSKMSESQKNGTTAYHLAEAGIQEAIFKLKNDAVWKNAFETLPSEADPLCSSWSIAPFTRNPALIDTGEYTITINNLGCGKAEISCLAKIQLSSNSIAQRMVKTAVFKALGSPVSEFNIFTGGAGENIDISSTAPLNIHYGNLFANNKIKISFWSEVNVDNKALANNKIDVSSWPFASQLNATTCASNICDAGCDLDECPPEQISMPPIDIDSEDPASYLSQAKNDDCSSIRTGPETNCLFTTEEFEILMWQNYPNLILPEDTIVFVDGDINLRAGQQLNVKGVIVAGRDINLGENFCWSRPELPFLRCGSSKIIVERPGTPEENKPSGILVKRKLDSGIWFGSEGIAMNVEGLVYVGDQLSFSGIMAPIIINGGIATRKFTSSSMWQGIDIYLEPDVIIDTFGVPAYSSVITIDHWEEEY